MFKALFNIMLNLMATIIQIIVWPINAIINATIPSLSSSISQVNSAFSTMFSCVSWGLGALPSSVISVLSFIVLCEIAKHTIFKSTYILTRVWNVFQKIKFW